MVFTATKLPTICRCIPPTNTPKQPCSRQPLVLRPWRRGPLRDFAKGGCEIVVQASNGPTTQTIGVAHCSCSKEKELGCGVFTGFTLR